MDGYKLTDEEIDEAADEYTRLCGDHWCYESAIPDGNVTDFARRIESLSHRKIFPRLLSMRVLTTQQSIKDMIDEIIGIIRK